jgi:ribonucleotide monophosphatase NagD (HAD superfamily)
MVRHQAIKKQKALDRLK